METTGAGPSGGAIDTPQHRALGSGSRVAILGLVRAAGGGLTAAEVAAATGQHLSTTRAHLERLVGAGLVVKARAGGGQPGRPAWRYRAAADDPAPAPYRTLAAVLLGQLRKDADGAAVAAERVGREWGRQLAGESGARGAVETVGSVFDGLGFSPVVHGEAGGVVDLHLRTCPFLELVDQAPDAMCALHAGVVRGVLDERGADGDAAVLEPFGAPRACVVRLPRDGEW
ncbi:helix-turn-helix transcriptional regulator [Actinosynnema sp.]|uniref:helix-turn-helix transcriptional regulator n=1 Tax=Actinosynnema sp. TaxID=1872144 RepID=UPI003F87F9D1